MDVKVRLFAGLREFVGQSEIPVSLAEGATIGDLGDRIGLDYPKLGPLLSGLAWAVNEEYRSRDYRLRDGDEIALIPPISGGCPCSK